MMRSGIRPHSSLPRPQAERAGGGGIRTVIGSSNDNVMGLFLEKPMGAPEVKPLLSDEHFSVDGTLLQA
jgi:hypothetical protein